MTIKVISSVVKSLGGQDFLQARPAWIWLGISGPRDPTPKKVLTENKYIKLIPTEKKILNVKQGQMFFV